MAQRPTSGVARHPKPLSLRQSCSALLSPQRGRPTNQSLAGAFQSILDVPSQDAPQLGKAIDEVISVFHDERDQVLVQPMIGEVTMCGVAMTRALEDGSPYYVINYDDVSGRTDTVTGGIGVSKTVCIYKGVRPEYFDSPRLWRVLDMLRGLERHYGQTPLDVEFAVDSAENVHLLQVRRICAARRWRANAGLGVSRPHPACGVLRQGNHAAAARAFRAAHASRDHAGLEPGRDHRRHAPPSGHEPLSGTDHQPDLESGAGAHGLPFSAAHGTDALSGRAALY